MEAKDFPKASQVQIDLMTRHFDKTGTWIMGVKRLIDSLEKAKNVRVPTPQSAGQWNNISQPSQPMRPPPPTNMQRPPPMMNSTAPPPQPPILQSAHNMSTPPVGNNTQAMPPRPTLPMPGPPSSLPATLMQQRPPPSHQNPSFPPNRPMMYPGNMTMNRPPMTRPPY